MKKRTKRLLALLLTLALVLPAAPLLSAHPIAYGADEEPYVSTNENAPFEDGDISAGVKMFNQIINSLKENKSSVQFHYATKEASTISWDNKNAVNSFDSQLANLGKADDGLITSNLSTMLKAAEGTTYYSPRSVTPRSLSFTDIPLTGIDISSRLTASDVKAIMYETNQSVTLDFTYRVVNDVPLAYIDPITLTGLDSITVYLQDDVVDASAVDFRNAHANNVIDLPDKEQLEQEQEITFDLSFLDRFIHNITDFFANLFSNTSGAEYDEPDIYKEKKNEVTTKGNGFNVRNAAVTLYFDPVSKKPVATVFDYDIDEKTEMNFDIKMQFNYSGLATAIVSELRNRGVQIKDNVFKPEEARVLLALEDTVLNVTKTTKHHENYYFMTDEDFITPHDHEYDSYSTIEEATCSHGGLIRFDCTVCGKTITGLSDPLPHTPKEPVTTTISAPTCLSDGEQKTTVSCAVCGFILDETTSVIPSTGAHTPGEPEEEIIDEPTCGDAGSKTISVICAICGEVLSERTEMIPPTGEHEPGEAVEQIVTQPTCGKPGVKKVTVRCEECWNILSETTAPVPATGAHTPGEPVTTRTAATCTTDGEERTVTKCTVCGEVLDQLVKVFPAGHKLVLVPAVAPTATNEGNIEYYICSVCSKCFADANASNEIDEASAILPKTEEEQQDKCPYCGKMHTGTFGSIVRFFHQILYFFRNLFGG